MRQFPTLLVKIAVIAAVAANQVAWIAYKLHHSKKYRNAVEEQARMRNFLQNLKEIARVNDLFRRGAIHYEYGENQFSDMSNDEFHSTNNGYLASGVDWCGGEDYIGEPVHVVPNGAVIPESIDWRLRGAVSPVKNQGFCDVCWAHSSCGALEAAHFLKTGQLIPLSPQHLLDCTKSEENKCYTQNYRDAYDYIRRTGGIDTDQSYPYSGTKERCKANARNSGATVRGHVRIPCGNETALTHAIATVGPVTVAIDDSLLYHYSRGVFNSPLCSQKMNHEVLVVGYGTNAHEGDYYIIKNSWGTAWGENGFFRLARNQGNLCGIANDAGYPLV